LEADKTRLKITGKNFYNASTANNNNNNNNTKFDDDNDNKIDIVTNDLKINFKASVRGNRIVNEEKLSCIKKTEQGSLPSGPQ